MMSILSFTCYDAEGISVTHNSSHVTYFAPRLNSDWPQRMQVLSLDKDRRLVPISMNSSGDGRETQSKFQSSRGVFQQFLGWAQSVHNISKTNYNA
ncbi:hypothetical protein AAZX31_09G190900 [Glycine max]